MVCSHEHSVSPCLGIVVEEKPVADGGALGGFDIHERHWIVHLAVYPLLADMPEIGDSQLRPHDGIFFPALAVLILGYVDAIDAFRGILHPLALEHAVFPFPSLQLVS